MKVEVECAPCLLHRGLREIKEATSDPNIQFKAISSLLSLLAREFKPTATPASLGTKRDELIREISGNPDPYARIKKLSNEKALEILPIAEEFVLKGENSETRFRRACLCAIAGNVMEFGIPDHTFQLKDLKDVIDRAEADLAIDDIPKILRLASRAKEIVYLTDNAGEIAFDTLLVRELRKLGAFITVAVKDKPILNDATMEDAKEVGMHEIADQVITTGSSSVGLFLEECSQNFIALYSSADLVVAKGMGYVETLTEFDLKNPHALLLRAKCEPMARFFNVSRGKNIAKLSVGKWK